MTQRLPLICLAVKELIVILQQADGEVYMGTVRIARNMHHSRLTNAFPCTSNPRQVTLRLFLSPHGAVIREQHHRTHIRMSLSYQACTPLSVT